MSLTDHDWEQFHKQGFMHLGKVLSDDDVAALKQRADDLALGTLKNPDVQMQLDTGGEYKDLPAAVAGFETGTLLYRKIQGLENDPLFLKLIRTPVFMEVCAAMYGRHNPISIFRAMIMNKPAGQGTILPWHQDGGDVWALDRDPLVTIWVALDGATRANGCMDCIPGSHRLGLLSLLGSIVSDENVSLHCPPDQVHPLEVEAGHAVLLHNWLIHRSGVNPSPIPRRAFTMCCMDGRTRSTLTGNLFPMIHGNPPQEASPFTSILREERVALEKQAQEATEYALSLAEDNKVLRQMREDAETYAKTLSQMREDAETYAKSLEAELAARDAREQARRLAKAAAPAEKEKVMK